MNPLPAIGLRLASKIMATLAQHTALALMSFVLDIAVDAYQKGTFATLLLEQSPLICHWL